MRVAIAGTCGLACLIAHYISEETNHNVLLLSRAAKPTLTARGFQIVVVDYDDMDDLEFALRGIDTVISTVTGPNQIQLIKAAVSSGTRRFAPAEFEGRPQLRPANDPLDCQRTNALNWLYHFRTSLEYTVFVCGVFYERFQRGGLPRELIARDSGYHGDGTYILNCTNMSAEIPVLGLNNQPAAICMSSVRDVARLVTKAIDFPTWPTEFRMAGDTLSVQNLVLLVQDLKKEEFHPCILHNLASLHTELAVAAAARNWARGMQLHTLIATAEGRYIFSERNLNAACPGVQMERFASWFVRKWNVQQPASE